MTEPLSHLGDNDPGSKEVVKKSGSNQMPAPGGGDNTVNKFFEKDKIQKKSIFRYLAAGTAFGVGKELGAEIPDAVRHFLEMLQQ